MLDALTPAGKSNKINLSLEPLSDGRRKSVEEREMTMTRIDRRAFLTGTAGLTWSLAALPNLAAGQEEEKEEKEKDDDAKRAALKLPVKKTTEYITPKTQRAINRGLAFLAKRQVTRGRNAGSFGGPGATVYSGGVATCGLAGIAFMCSGSPPGEGPYGKHVDRCVDFILKNVQESGYISTPGGSDRMYGHGFATLFLAETYGMSMRPEVGKKLQKAVKLIVETQNDAGGWRYMPRKSDADLSITICQIMALRAARDAGIFVPGKTRKQCIEYVKKSQNPDGGFRYTITSGGSSFPLTGAGIVSLYSANVYEGDAIKKGLEHLMKYLPGKGRSSSSYYFYSHYYAVQATWHAGGEYWGKWYPAIRDELLSSQQGDGSWVDSSVGPDFGTAMACIILQIPNDYLPIFGR